VLDHIISLITMMTLLLVTLVTSAVLLLRARTRRAGLWILSAFAVLGAALGWHLFYPHTFERHYSPPPPNSPAVSLRRRAEAAGIFLGAAGDESTLADPLFPSTFNSMTPDNALKLDALLSDGRVGTYDSRDVCAGYIPPGPLRVAENPADSRWRWTTSVVGRRSFPRESGPEMPGLGGSRSPVCQKDGSDASQRVRRASRGPKAAQCETLCPSKMIWVRVVFGVPERS
jgi:hypothetical protein